MSDKDKVIELANDLIKTLGDMTPSEADAVVKSVAERMLNELAGIKGRIKCQYSCILLKSDKGIGSTECVFIEE